MAKPKASSKHLLIGAGTKSLGRPDVVFPKGRMSRKSGNGKTTSRKKRVAGK